MFDTTLLKSINTTEFGTPLAHMQHIYETRIQHTTAPAGRDYASYHVLIREYQ